MCISQVGLRRVTISPLRANAVVHVVSHNDRWITALENYFKLDIALAESQNIKSHVALPGGYSGTTSFRRKARYFGNDSASADAYI